MIEVGDLLEPAEAQRGGKRRDDQPATQSRRQFDRRFRERADIGRDRLLHRLWRDAHVVERVVFAVVRDAVLGRPQPPDQLKPLFENPLVVGERHMERQIFALVVAAPAGKIDPAAGKKIERRPLLGDANRMMQRQHRHRRRKPDAGGVGGDIGEHEVRAGQHAERIEMMLADPGRMHAELVGIERLGGDVGDELVRGARIIFVVIIAQRKVAEIHVSLPGSRSTAPLYA